MKVEPKKSEKVKEKKPKKQNNESGCLFELIEIIIELISELFFD